MVRLLVALLVFVVSASAQAAKYLVSYRDDSVVSTEHLSPEEIRFHWRAMTARAEASVLGARLLQNARTLWIANATMAELDDEEAARVRKNPRVSSVMLLGRRARLSDSALAPKRPYGEYTYGLENIGLHEVNRRQPRLDGAGQRVGIIDTGVQATHPSLRKKTVAFHDYIGRGEETYDDYGHGSFVAGVIAGDPSDGTRIGVAPAAKLVVAKAFSQFGGSEDASLLAALQWMADPDGNPRTDDGPRVISNSWNVDSNIAAQTPADEPFCRVIDRLRELGILSVFSAGNDGPGASSILVPGACPSALTVGASDSDDAIADFSSRGPIHWKSGALPKPELAAPGVDVFSAWRDSEYVYKSGTSMATPFAAGAAALLLQHNPSLKPDEIKSALAKSARDKGPSGFDPAYGHGILWLPAALD